jgi:hypothetical protein
MQQRQSFAGRLLAYFPDLPLLFAAGIDHTLCSRDDAEKSQWEEAQYSLLPLKLNCRVPEGEQH